jgi:hypothetical protein
MPVSIGPTTPWYLPPVDVEESDRSDMEEWADCVGEEGFGGAMSYNKELSEYIFP